MDREEKLRKIFQEPLKSPKEFDDMVEDTLNSISNRKKTRTKNSLKWLTRVAAVFVLGLVGTTVWAGVSGKLNLNLRNIGYQKVAQNYEENAYEINEKIENEYFTFQFESIAVDNSYIITENRVYFTDKYFDETGGFGYSEVLGYSFGFNETISVNDKEKTPRISCQKISENEYLYMYFIDITDFEREDNFTLKINLDKFQSDRRDWEVKYDVEGIGYYDNHYFEQEIGKSFEVKLKLPVMEEQEIIAEQKVHDNTTVQILKIGSTKFENYMRMKVLKTGTWSMTQDVSSLEAFSYGISDENGNHIRFIKYPERIIDYDGNTGEVLQLNNQKKVEMDQPIIIEENYFIRLENDIHPEKLTLQLYHYMFPDKKTEQGTKDIEFYENATWYDVEEGDKIYQGESDYGDILRITKTEIDEDTITFYYEADGDFPNGLSFVIRNTALGKMNYIFPSRIEIKGLNSTENKIIFDRRQGFYESGLNLTKDMLNDIDNLQFSIMQYYTDDFVPIGEKITIDFPEESEDIAEVLEVTVY